MSIRSNWRTFIRENIQWEQTQGYRTQIAFCSHRGDGYLKTCFSHLDEITWLTMVDLGLCFPNFSGQENYQRTFLNILIHKNGVESKNLNINKLSSWFWDKCSGALLEEIRLCLSQSDLKWHLWLSYLPNLTWKGFLYLSCNLMIHSWALKSNLFNGHFSFFLHSFSFLFWSWI